MSNVVKAAHAAYRLDGNDQEWLEELVEMIGPLLNRGRGLLGFRWRIEAGELLAKEFITFGGVEGDEEMFRGLMKNLDPRRARLAYATPHGFRTLSEIAIEHPNIEDPLADKDMQRLAHDREVLDFEMLHVDEAEKQGWVFSVMRTEIGEIPRLRRAVWERVGAHIAAGVRLRIRLGGSSLEESAAIFDPMSKRLEIQHPELQSKTRKERLRQLIEARNQAQQLADDRPLEAMELWQGLVAGRWSLLDVLDSDGRFFTVLRENSIDARSTVRLSERERQVAYLVGRGRHIKLVAYELGLSPSTVRSQLRAALAKLNLEDRSGLVRLVNSVFSADETKAIDGMRVLALAQQPLSLPRVLTEAERDVARLVYDGLTTKEIAKRRGTAGRTVANQLASIYRKLDISSRQELVAKLGQDS